jgi:hypothetical protein
MSSMGADPVDGIRFYAGAPIHGSEGISMGVVCVMDMVPRRLAPSQREALLELDRRADVLLAARRASREVGSLVRDREQAAREVARREAASSNARFAVAFGASPIGMAVTDLVGTILEVNESVLMAILSPPGTSTVSSTALDLCMSPVSPFMAAAARCRNSLPSPLNPGLRQVLRRR